MRKCRTKNIKYDDFYTDYTDIENTVEKYKDFLHDKTIYCNCDNYEQSNFVKYFTDNFERLKIKEVIATSFNPIGKGSYFTYNGTSTEIQQLVGNGDFRSLECTKILEKADIVITNPPFSLFREYIEQLYTYNKQFLIVGIQTAIINKEIFNLWRENKITIVDSFKGNVGFFYSEYENTVDKRNIYKEGCIRISGVLWYTNLPTQNKPYLELEKEYNDIDYPKYDNYNAIEVSKTKNIPKNYFGVLGVPITFIYKYNPEQFKIIGISASWDKIDIKNNPNTNNPTIQGKIKYTRIFIQAK